MKTTASNYIVVNIGCIECGVSSKIVGVFDSKEKADKVAEICDGKYDWREGGQNSFLVFKIPEINIIDSEYDVESEIIELGLKID